MAKNYIEPGDQIDAIAPSGGVVSGNIYKFAGIVGVALTSADEGEPFALKIRGAFKLPLTGGKAASFGSRVYMAAANTTLKLTPAENDLEIGFILKPVGIQDNEVGTNEAVVCLGAQIGVATA